MRQTGFLKYCFLLAVVATIAAGLREYAVAADANATGDEQPLIALLQSDGPSAEKALACKQLAVCGTADAAPALGALLRDKELASWARIALEVIPGSTVDAELRKAMDEVEGRLLVGVINSIAVRRDAKAARGLIAHLDSADEQVAVSAAVALGQIGGEAAIKSLVPALDEERPTVRSAAAEGLVLTAERLLASGDADAAARLYDQVRHAKVPKQRIVEATRGAILAQGSDGLPLLLEQLRSNDKTMLNIGLMTARELPGSNVTKALAAELRNTPADRQALLLHALAGRNDKAALPAVLQFVERGGPHEARIVAAKSLVQLGDASCISALLVMANEKEMHLSEAALETLKALPGKDVDADLVARLANGEGAFRQVLIQAVGRRRLVAANRALFAAADDKDPQIRAAALHALGSAAQQKDLAQLISRAVTPKHPEDSEAASAALRAAAVRMPDREACAAQLSEAMAGTPVASKRMIIEILGSMGGQRALATLAKTMKEDNEELKDAVSRVLGQWMTVDAAPVLLDIAKDSSNGRFQVRALRGYLRIARQFNMTPQEKLQAVKNALAAAQRTEEKRLAIDTLARTPSAEAVSLAATYLDDAELKEVAAATIAAIEKEFVSLFDGKSTKGWSGDPKIFRAKDGMIVGGSLKQGIDRNEFLCTEKEYGDFELRLQFQLHGDHANSGVQIRSKRDADSPVVRGYQADLGDNWWGCLYDEGRRSKVLAGPPEAKRTEPLRRGEWNDYRIRCEGPRIRLWINNVLTVDYTEEDSGIPLRGILALQVHAGEPMEAWYRMIRIREL